MENTLFISDAHAPYHHPDTLQFLKAVKKKYKIKVFKCVGDLVDNHFSSFHPIEYGTLSAEEEHRQAKSFIQALNKIFPTMTISLGNHCVMTARQAQKAGIVMDHIKSYNDMYEIKGWKWVDRDYFKVDKHNHCLMVHAMSKNTLSNARSHSHHSVQGHYHGTYGIEYFADTEYLRWSMTVGCLIDTKAKAFNYSKGYTNNKPIIGVGVVVDDLPHLVPMVLNKKGRWVGTL